MKDRIYRFAEFELIASDGELRTKDARIRLQEKPLLLLSVLLDNPQRLVTREELRERMWDRDTFVDYEQGINVAVKKVRDALGDSAQSPRIIETIAKKGYRLLVPAQVTCSDQGTDRASPRPSAPEAAPDGPIPHSAAVPRHSARSRWLIVAAAAGVLTALGLWRSEWKSKHQQPLQIRSVAVLPLQNLSPDPGQEYVADGITEDLITNLAQSLPLRVISRTSIMRYKQTSEPVGQIARELGAEAIVEGSVARSGSRVTVTVQLIDAAADRHLWAQRYERDLGDLLGVEAELSQAIAAQVGSALIPRQRTAGPISSHPVDPQVYDLCLMGRYHWNRRTPAELSKAVSDFEEAIRRDPNYAPAWAGLADAYVISPSYESVDIDRTLTQAAEAARHAIALDDTLAEAHAALGMVAINRASAASEAEREFRRALELNPNYATAHQWFSFHLVFSHRLNEALAEIELARQLDPLSAIINADEGHLLYAMGRYDAAKPRLRQSIELAPDLGQPHETLALIALAEGRDPDAVDEARQGLALDASNPRTIGEAGYVLAAAGHKAEAGKLLAAVDGLVRGGSSSPTYAALIYVGLGERGKALDMLEGSAASTRMSGPVGLDQWPTVFSQLSAEPRYSRLIAATRR